MDYQQTVQQLGGNQFKAMTGATFIADGNTLVVKFKGSEKCNIVYIELNSMDLYNVSFFKYKGLNVKPVSEFENIYAEDLRGLFERQTGLRTSLTAVYA